MRRHSSFGLTVFFLAKFKKPTFVIFQEMLASALLLFGNASVAKNLKLRFGNPPIFDGVR